MYIKKVVLEGFKSYAQRTEIDGFDPLFNAITGLNGSGKSNILDAICFLLGITNLSQVRAGNLQDLVYKGGQAGVTRATVTITFDNSDSRQSPLGYETYEEITVSRQVVIGGRNKYLINGSNATPSRVQDLFRSVQLNVNNPHFLIMQGRVTKVLNMKPIEILSMIEEAAGTRLYESKKASAQKTIVKKESKLQEIQTILDEEITPTIRKLKEERSSYLEFQKVTRELEHLNQLTIAWQYWQAEQTRKQSASDLEDMKKEIEELQQKIKETEEDIERLKTAAQELEKRRKAESQGPIVQLEKEVDGLAKSCAVAEATLQASRDELTREEKNLSDMKKTFEEDSSLLASKRTELELAEKECAALRERSREAEEAVKKSRTHFQAVTAGLSSGSDGQDDTLAAQKIACENEISTAVTATKQAEMRLQSAEDELREVEGGVTEEAASYSRDRSSLDALQKTIEKLEVSMKKLNYREGQEKELVTKRDKLMGEMSSLKEKIHHLESKFPQIQFEYNDPSASFDRRRVRGPVVRLMRVEEREAATALEVTAGGRLYNVVVDTEETGKQLLQKGGLRRRYTIIPLNKISSHSIPDNTTRKAQSLVGGGDKVRPALSLVGYEEDLRPAMAYVFGSTFVCDTLKIAKQVTFDKEVMTRSVSLAGDVFDPAGTLTGGARASSSSILLQLDQLWSLEQQLREKEAELTDLSTQLASLEQLAAKYHGLKEEREEKAHEAEVVRVRLEQSSHHRQMEHLRQLKENITQLKETVKEAKVSEKKARKRLDDIQRKMKEFGSHRDAELKAAEEEMVRVREEAVGVVREAKTRQQQVEALRMELEELEKSLQNQRLLMEQCSEGISKKMSTVEENQTAESEAQASLQEARARLEDVRGAARERNKELQRYDAERRGREKEKAGHVLAAKEVEHRVTKFQKHSREAAAKVESLLTHYEWIATDRQYFGQPNTAYDFQANDPKEASRRVEKLKEQKEKLSKTVNMRAMNMLGKAEERYNDLLKKKEIVANDKTKIVKLIEELDQKKNATLKEAHHRVNRDFGSIFSTLLPGTEACLSPPEGQTVLDGLEVRVAFGRVWKDSLQELSGGQRSLVALSLILSLLLFKPAPVYILDEVDAALDLSHTQNIGQMLRSHFQSSQFIVVSLKDGMFNNANVLFKTKYVNPRATRRPPPPAATTRERDTEKKSTRKLKRVRLGPVATPTK